LAIVRKQGFQPVWQNLSDGFGKKVEKIGEK